MARPGTEGIIGKLSRRGVELHLAANRSGIVVIGSGGSRPQRLHDAVRAASPLLLPYLITGKPPTCAVGKHKTPVPAVTVAAGAPYDVPWCGAADCEPSKMIPPKKLDDVTPPRYVPRTPEERAGLKRAVA